MATGAIDGNGIWQYGEDDSVSPWSGFMNLGQGSTSTAIGAAKTRLTALEVVVAGAIGSTGSQVVAAATTATVLAGASPVLSGGVTVASNGLKVPTTGWYQISAQVSLDTTATAIYRCHIAVNGTIRNTCEEGQPGGAYVHVGLSRALNLAANDVVTLQVYNGDSAARTVQSPVSTWLTVSRIG